MIIKKISIAFLGVGLTFGTAFSQTHKAYFPYQNPKNPIEVRVKDLLGRMSIDEKVAQTLCLWLKKPMVMDDKGNLDTKKALTHLSNGIGQIARPSEKKGTVTGSRSPGETVEFANQVQNFLRKQTKWGIPAFLHEESLHGNQAKDATHFPSHLGLACTWNPDLFTEVYSAVAKEVRVRGAQQVLAPVVDLGRDPRWGRTEETLGEDPYLASRLAVASVLGYQGEPNGGGYFPKDKVAATLKHFGVHGSPEAGINIAPVSMDERTLREIVFPSFKAAIQEAQVSSIMPCYNELNGIPAHTNKFLLDQVLRKEWGFKGQVVSDYMALDDLRTIHKVVGEKDSTEAAYLAAIAGVDVETPDFSAYPKLKKLIQSGRLPMATLDSMVARVLRLKFRMGLFESWTLDPKEADAVVGNGQHAAIALKAARESIVLLKNQRELLPLQIGKYKRIAIIGPNADKCVLGGYANQPKYCNTPYQILSQRLKGKAEIVFAEGCRITDKGDWFQDSVVLSDPNENRKRIQEAIKAASTADIILLFVGGNEATSREAWSKSHMGDLAQLELLGQQQELAEALAKLGKPMVGVVISGPPLALEAFEPLTQSLVQGWYLGQETGNALADVLLGDYNPSGKLAISMPRTTGHLPCYYNYKPSARRGFHFADVSPLFPFGHGLNYSNFSMTPPKVETTKAPIGSPIVVSVSVANNSKVKGTETIQVYLRDEVSSVTRPIKELKAFKKVTLQPGESQLVNLLIKPDAFGFYNEQMKFITEPGFFTIMVGFNSNDLQKVRLELE